MSLARVESVCKFSSISSVQQREEMAFPYLRTTLKRIDHALAESHGSVAGLTLVATGQWLRERSTYALKMCCSGLELPLPIGSRRGAVSILA